MVLIQTRERIIVERDITLELPMQVATLMVLRALGLLCYTTSSQSSRRPSLRAIRGNRLRQGRRNASNPRCACAVAVGCGLGRRFCGTGQRHGRRHPRNSWEADPPCARENLSQLARGLRPRSRSANVCRRSRRSRAIASQNQSVTRTNHTDGGGSRMRRSESAAFRSLAR